MKTTRSRRASDDVTGDLNEKKCQTRKGTVAALREIDKTGQVGLFVEKTSTWLSQSPSLDNN